MNDRDTFVHIAIMLLAGSIGIGIVSHTESDIICFITVTAMATICLLLAIKKKLPCWKFQVGWLLFNEVVAILLLRFLIFWK